MKSQRKSIRANARTALVQDVSRGGASGDGERSVHCIRFCCEPKAALRNPVCLKVTTAIIMWEGGRMGESGSNQEQKVVIVEAE